MSNSARSTLQDRPQHPHQRTARAVGVLLLAGMVVYVTGNALVESILAQPDHLAIVSANSTQLALGGVLMLMAAAFDATHGVLMLPVLRQHNERIAFGYFAARIVDAALLSAGVILILLQIPRVASTWQEPPAPRSWRP